MSLSFLLKVRSKFFSAIESFDLVYQSDCSHTIADQLYYDWIAEKNVEVTHRILGGQGDPPLFTKTNSTSSAPGCRAGIDQTAAACALGLTVVVLRTNLSILSSAYQSSSTLLDFSDHTRTGSSKLISHCALVNSSCWDKGCKACTNQSETRTWLEMSIFAVMSV